MTEQRNVTFPLQLFKDDLIAQMEKYKDEGYRFILCMDENKNIFTKTIAHRLTDSTTLGMRNVVKDHMGKEYGDTYFRGSEPIDAVCATSNVTVVYACVMPVWYGVGDHILFVVNFTAE